MIQSIQVTDELDESVKTLPAIAGPFRIGMELPNLKGKFFYCKGTGKRMRDLSSRYPLPPNSTTASD